METVATHKCHGGTLRYIEHDAEQTACRMRFSVFLPSKADKGATLPALYYLSGLTCTEENFTVKAGAYKYAEEAGLVIIAPDTSPRGAHVHDEEGDNIGKGAGFYIDATRDPWAKHYRMESYIASELYQLCAANFPIDTARTGILGHSMGGHGALTLALKYPEQYRSVSALAPICAATRSPTGKRVFTAYLGSVEAGEPHDACALIAGGKRFAKSARLLVDQGDADPFLPGLMPDALQKACGNADIGLDLRMREGYDHGYFFVQSFIEGHVRHHASIL